MFEIRFLNSIACSIGYYIIYNLLDGGFSGMKYLPIYPVILLFAVLLMSCDETQDLFDTPTDPLIDENVIEAQDYNFETPVYGMQVAIDNRVDSGTQSILNLLDNRATQFLNCQFVEGSDLGFEDVMLEDGTIVPPLSELRVYVVPNRFECEAEGVSVCAGEEFPGNDVIVISEGGFLGCGEFAVWKHELGHRYGMKSDHSNQDEFKSCIKPQNCNAGDFFD